MKESMNEFLKREKEDKLKIASFNLWEKITVRKANLSRGTIQRAYKEMKRTRFGGNQFRGDVIDYLCYESLEEFVANVVVGIEIIGSFKKTFEYTDAYLDIYKNISLPIFRLLLKDETYFVEAFKYAGVDTNSKIFIEAKRLINRKMNVVMTSQLRKHNKLSKLSSS